MSLDISYYLNLILQQRGLQGERGRNSFLKQRGCYSLNKEWLLCRQKTTNTPQGAFQFIGKTDIQTNNNNAVFYVL